MIQYIPRADIKKDQKYMDEYLPNSRYVKTQFNGSLIRVDYDGNSLILDTKGYINVEVSLFSYYIARSLLNYMERLRFSDPIFRNIEDRLVMEDLYAVHSIVPSAITPQLLTSVMKKFYGKNYYTRENKILNRDLGDFISTIHYIVIEAEGATVTDPDLLVKLKNDVDNSCLDEYQAMAFILDIENNYSINYVKDKNTLCITGHFTIGHNVDIKRHLQLQKLIDSINIEAPVYYMERDRASLVDTLPFIENGISKAINIINKHGQRSNDNKIPKFEFLNIMDNLSYMVYSPKNETDKENLFKNVELTLENDYENFKSK